MTSLLRCAMVQPFGSKMGAKWGQQNGDSKMGTAKWG